MAKGLGIAAAVVLGAVMFAGGSSASSPRPLPRPPKPDEEEGGGLPQDVLDRIAAAVASQDPEALRAEAKRLRKEGYPLEAYNLEEIADELESKKKNPEPAPGPRPPAPASVRNLVRGMKGEDVRAWQKVLIHDGYANVVADADFGQLTFAATTEWQWERELKDDGIVGPKTLAAIGSSPTRKRPDEEEGGKEERAVPQAILVRIAVAVASQDPVMLRAEAKKLRKEGYVLQAQSLENLADELEAKKKNPEPAPGPRPPAPASVRNLVRGMKGEDVRAWQKVLIHDGYRNVVADADFGQLTFAATTEWQWERELKDDGIVGPKTLAAIGTAPKRKRPVVTPPAPAPSPLPRATVAGAVRNLVRGMKGEDVRAWQKVLIHDGYAKVVADADFGQLTFAATTEWQWERELKDDGIVGPKTLAAIGTAPKRTRATAAPAVVTPPTPKPPAPAPPIKIPAPPAPNRPPGPPLPPAPSAKGTVPALLVGVTLRKVPDSLPADPRVTLWQDKLRALGFRSATTKSDGKFGTNTEAQTGAFQQTKKLGATGVADPLTIATAYGAPAPKAAPAPAAVPVSPALPPLVINLASWRSVLKKGSKGNDVREWQQVLSRYGFVVATDGDFGQLTHVATVAWQTAYANFAGGPTLVPDGVVGKMTRDRVAALEAPKQIVAGDVSEVPRELLASLVHPRLFAATPPGLQVVEPHGFGISLHDLALDLVRNLEQTSPGNEDRELVKRFQSAHGLNQTGNYGPATAEVLIAIGIIPPGPRYWPSKKLWRAQARYRVALREQAHRDPARAAEWLGAAGSLSGAPH